MCFHNIVFALRFCSLPGCFQWLPDPAMLTQGPQGVCYRYDTERRVSTHQKSP